MSILRKTLLISLAAVCLIGLSACQTTEGTRSAKDESSEVAEIRQVLDQQAVAWNRGDLKGFMVGYHDSPKLRFASNNSVFHGYQGAYDSYKKSFADKSKMSQLAFSELDIQILSANSALVFGRFTNTYGQDKPSKTGLFTLVMKKMPEGWRIVHDHSSDAADKENK